MAKIIATTSIFLLIAIHMRCTSGKNDDSPIITPNERILLNRFRQLVADDLPKNYMLKDVYLMKWLRMANLNIKDAVEKLHKMLEWRKEENIDQVMEEDFSDFEREFPFTMDSVDYIGRPVATADIEDWDARKVILSGRRERAIRFIYKMAEVGILQVIEANEKNPNVTSSILLANLQGFNSLQHACSECIPIYRNLVMSMESYFPYMIYKLVGINTPMKFYSVFTLFVPLLSKKTMSLIKLFGTDKRQWKPYILSLVPPEQLEHQFGGVKKGQHEV